MIILFSMTLALSAFLLFTIQPLVAKLILPVAGGTPAVWNCCSFFFSTALLIGYWYVDKVTKKIDSRYITLIQIGLLIAALGYLFFSPQKSIEITPSKSIVLQIVMYLTFIYGLPITVLAMSAPLLQLFYSKLNAATSNDPYFLYAASNIGSFLALASYPLFFEPRYTLHQQLSYWIVGYGFLTLLMGVVFSRVVTLMKKWNAQDQAQTALASEEVIPLSQKLHWLFCAFLPVSLMLSVTTAITTNIAPIPLFWVVPLGLYLLTFIFSFSRKPLFRHELFARYFPVLLVVAIPVVCYGQSVVGLLCILFYVGMLCHGTLAASRPEVGNLTSFYLLISVGGMLGSLFNTFLAPAIFKEILELPLAIALVGLALPLHNYKNDKSVGVVAIGNLLLVGGVYLFLTSMPREQLNTVYLKVLLMVGVTGVIYYLKARPLSLAISSTASVILFLSFLHIADSGKSIAMYRNFYGSKRIQYTDNGNAIVLVHGNTTHGYQSILPEYKSEPSGYYTKAGPVGEAIRVMKRHTNSNEYGVIGLGTGAVTCNMLPHDRLTYFELDPEIVAIANNPELFSFLQNCPTQLAIKTGDGRKLLEQEPDKKYAYFFIDAFSSDTIPAHLLTKEALALYMQKSTEEGVVQFHISNRYLNLIPVVSGIAQDAGLPVIMKRDLNPHHEDRNVGRIPSLQMIVTKNARVFNELKILGWEDVTSQKSSLLWTDDHYSLLEILSRSP